MPEGGKRYERENAGLSFDRVAFFADAVYAIALTLIVVGIGVPTLDDATSASDLWRGLREQLPQIVSFFVGVIVIGFYWAANHDAIDRLAAVDRAFVLLIVGYVALVAFLPFPIRLVGTYDENPAAMILLTVNLAAVSAMEAVLFRHAWRGHLLQRDVSANGYRWLLLMSLLPVPVFLISIPLVFINPFLAPLAWGLLTWLFSTLAGSRRPAELRDY